MNKKAELVLFFGMVMVFLLAVGTIWLTDDVINQNTQVSHVGDNSTKIVYYIKSTNPKCGLNQITIKKENLVYFADAETAISEGFSVDNNCN